MAAMSGQPNQQAGGLPVFVSEGSQADWQAGGLHSFIGGGVQLQMQPGLAASAPALVENSPAGAPDTQWAVVAMQPQMDGSLRDESASPARIGQWAVVAGQPHMNYSLRDEGASPVYSGQAGGFSPPVISSNGAGQLVLVARQQNKSLRDQSILMATPVAGMVGENISFSSVQRSNVGPRQLFAENASGVQASPISGSGEENPGIIFLGIDAPSCLRGRRFVGLRTGTGHRCNSAAAGRCFEKAAT